ncbi:MAG: 50S ribosomal protein L15 [Planctomycetaceae bacterium]
MILNDVHQGVQKRKKRKRIGRGTGSGHGKTAGHGHKGYYSRAGSSRRLSFEGGQMPFARRVAKRGFNNKKFADVVFALNVSVLQAAFEAGDEVTPTELVARGLVKGKFDAIKILGNGQLDIQLNVSVHRFSKTAEDKITAAGGTATRV